MPDLTPLERELLECLRIAYHHLLTANRLPSIDRDTTERIAALIRRAESREQPADTSERK